eukprot:scaffold223417_cov33-Tisochrysis_lutea.AAC.1
MEATQQTQAPQMKNVVDLAGTAPAPPSLHDDSSSNDQHSQAGESTHDPYPDEFMEPKSHHTASGKIGKTTHSPRWAISKKAKLILEQIYQMERFPSSEMHRRLAEDFEVEPRQVQFWFQNRRQRDSRALKAAQAAPADADSKSSETNTTNAEAILEQLRRMKEARGALNSLSAGCPPARPMHSGPMMPGQMFLPSQSPPNMFVPGSMLSGSPLMNMPQFTSQMYASHLSGSMPHVPYQVPMVQQQPSILQPQQLGQQQPASMMTSTQPMMNSTSTMPPHPMLQMMPGQMPPHIAQMLAMQGHMPPQQPLGTPGLQVPWSSPQPSNSIPPARLGVDGLGMARAPASAYFMPATRMAPENEDIAATAMMGMRCNTDARYELDERMRSQ